MPGGGRWLSGGRGDAQGGARIWNKRRSMCERINEEKEDINVGISGQLEVLSPTTRLADFDHLSIYKRHHRHRPILPGSSSSPNLIDILLSDHPISLNQPHPHPPPLPPPPKKSQRRTSAKNGMATLIPRNDSFNARTRGASHIDFRTATTGVIGKAMRNELSQLVNTVPDSKTRKASFISTIYPTSIVDLPTSGLRHRNAVLFLSLHSLSCRAGSGSGVVSLPFLVITDTALTFFDRDWDRIKSPGDDQIVPYSSLSKPKDSSALSKLAVLKVNGGLGTSMGMHLPCLEASRLNSIPYRYDWREERARGQRRHDIPRPYRSPDRAPQHNRACRCPAHPHDLL